MELTVIKHHLIGKEGQKFTLWDKDLNGNGWKNVIFYQHSLNKNRIFS